MRRACLVSYKTGSREGWLYRAIPCTKILHIYLPRSRIVLQSRIGLQLSNNDKSNPSTHISSISEVCKVFKRSTGLSKGVEGPEGVEGAEGTDRELSVFSPAFVSIINISICKYLQAFASICKYLQVFASICKHYKQKYSQVLAKQNYSCCRL